MLNASILYNNDTILTVDKLKQDLPNTLLEFSVWLSRNKDNYLQDDLITYTNSFVNFDKTSIPYGLLWDNLFYQVVTQKDFYCKETIIQLLIALNFI